MPLQQENLYSKITGILQKGCFLAIETQFHDGKLQEAISMASAMSDDGNKRWFKIKFQEHREILTVELGLGDSLRDSARGYGHIFINHDPPFFILPCAYKSKNDMGVYDDFLRYFPQAQFDRRLNDELIHLYEKVYGNTAFCWEIRRGHLRFDEYGPHFISEKLRRRKEKI